MNTQNDFRTPGDDINLVAVAVCRWPDGNTHAGVIYRHNENQLRILHLEDDRKFKTDIFFGKFGWIEPKLHNLELENIRSVCRSLWRRKPQYRYSWVLDIDAILDEKTRELVSKIAPNGLTCSTFVLSVFQTAQIRIIDVTNWPIRADDEIRYRGLLSYFRRSGMDSDQLDYLQKNVKTIRVRPEETAGACMSPIFPVSFQLCESNGRAVLQRLASLSDLSSPELNS